VRGTFEVFEAAAAAGIDKVVFISTTSVYRPDTRYGGSKILAELIAEDYRKHRRMNVVTLRPRGFIPYWDHAVYSKYSDWARWFWKGAVHIDDVATAVMLSLDLLSRRQLDRRQLDRRQLDRRQLDRQLVLTLDSAYEYTDADLDHWDAEGPGAQKAARRRVCERVRPWHVWGRAGAQRTPCGSRKPTSASPAPPASDAGLNFTDQMRK
jgi:Polysaccharide biosynthesis protein